VPLAGLAVPSATPPPGYVWWTDPAGAFRVAVPRGWRTVRSADGLVATAPAGQPVLGVALWTARGDLVSALIAEEGQARPPGYRRHKIDVASGPPGALWEFTFQDPRAGAMRAQRRVVTLGGRSYRVDWRAPAADWATDLPTLLAVLPTVGPVPGA
jgi:hypothetical protein